MGCEFIAHGDPFLMCPKGVGGKDITRNTPRTVLEVERLGGLFEILDYWAM